MDLGEIVNKAPPCLMVKRSRSLSSILRQDILALPRKVVLVVYIRARPWALSL